MPAPLLRPLPFRLAIVFVVAASAAAIALSWISARRTPMTYDSDGRARLAWHRWTAPHPKVPIVLVVVDTLRADAIGPYGAAPSPTPRLDSFAQDSVVFDNATTAAIWTLPSFASMFTGLYPPAHGVLAPEHRLHDAHVTLAEVLRGAGYETAAFTAGGFLAKRYGLDQGFSTYRYRSATRTLAESVDGALEWLARRDDDRPYFLCVHGFDPHRPYRPRTLPSAPDGFEPPSLDASVEIEARLEDGATFDEFALGGLRLAEVTVDLKRQPDFDDKFWKWVDERFPTRERMHDAWREDPAFANEVEWLRRLYTAKLPEADESFGRLLDALAARGDLDRAIVVFVSDHGEELMDTSMIGHTRAARSVCRVPLLMKPPRDSDIGPRRVKKVVRTIDILPTVLDWAGLATPPVQGRSLLPLMRGHDLPSMPAATFGTRHPENSIRYRGYRLVDRAVTPDDLLPALRLYDVKADPNEEHPLTHTDPGMVEQMRILLGNIEQESRRLAFAMRRAGESDGDDQALQELGYLGGE